MKRDTSGRDILAHFRGTPSVTVQFQRVLIIERFMTINVHQVHSRHATDRPFDFIKR